MKETYLKVISDDLSHKLSSIKVPTTIIWGDKDTLTPVEDAYFIHQKIRHSELVVFPGIQHALQMEVPEALTKKIIKQLP